MIIFEEIIKTYYNPDDLEKDIKSIKHEEFTSFLLNSKLKYGSNNNQSIRETIQNYWNVEIEQVLDILRGYQLKEGQQIKNIKVNMLHSIISGPLDVDKLDYLQRISHNCFLKYGDLIDEDRLIRNLSVIICEDNEEKKYEVAK